MLISIYGTVTAYRRGRALLRAGRVLLAGVGRPARQGRPNNNNDNNNDNNYEFILVIIPMIITVIHVPIIIIFVIMIIRQGGAKI